MEILASIVLILQLSFSLLSSAAANPNLTAAERASVTEFANYAVSVALQAVSELPTSTQAVVLQATSTPTGATSTPYEVPPVPVFGSAPEIQKEIVFDTASYVNQNGRYYNIRAYYTENGKNVAGVLMTVAADDAGTFNADGKGGANSMLTRLKVANDGSAGATFQYIPAEAGTRTLTFTANGATAVTTVPGQISQ